MKFMFMLGISSKGISVERRSAEASSEWRSASHVSISSMHCSRKAVWPLFLQGLVNVPFWEYWTSPYSSHLVDHIPNGWVMWKMGTWLMTHVLSRSINSGFGRLGQSLCPDLLRFPPIHRGDARIIGAGGVDWCQGAIYTIWICLKG